MHILLFKISIGLYMCISYDSWTIWNDHKLILKIALWGSIQVKRINKQICKWDTTSWEVGKHTLKINWEWMYYRVSEWYAFGNAA